MFPCSDLINSSQSYPVASRPRPRPRSVSLTSMSSSHSRITLDFVNTASALVTLHPLAHDARGSFTPTASARTALLHIKNSGKPVSLSTDATHRIRPRFVWPDDDDSPLSSDPPSPTISISRIALPSFISGGLSPTSTSSSTLVGYQQGGKRIMSDELNPILAKLERKSRLLSHDPCSTCNKQGSGYPKCGSCNAMWCSRECRLVGGKKHTCSQKIAR